LGSGRQLCVTLGGCGLRPLLRDRSPLGIGDLLGKALR
jgi:hypothetical protein